MKSFTTWLANAVLVASLVGFTAHADAAETGKQKARTRPSTHTQATARQTAVAQSDDTNELTNTSDNGGGSDDPKPCHWWQFRRCDDGSKSRADTLPPDAPQQGPVITVDVSTHTAYLFEDGDLVASSPAATGSGKLLKKGTKVWLFHTPQGHLKVLRKIVDPVWTKPDWAFIEAGEPVPPPDSPKRQVRGHLGKYALALGDGILIHGTDDPSSIGKPASHGCIRLPEEMLEQVYKAAKVGTDVYIFESNLPATQQAGNRGVPEHHSDLDYH